MTKLNDPNVYGKILSIPGIRDRAYVQIGYVNLILISYNLNLVMINSFQNISLLSAFCTE